MSDSERQCDSCGKFGALDFDGLNLCADCHAARASSCAGEREIPPEATPPAQVSGELPEDSPDPCLPLEVTTPAPDEPNRVVEEPPLLPPPPVHHGNRIRRNLTRGILLLVAAGAVTVIAWVFLRDPTAALEAELNQLNDAGNYSEIVRISRSALKTTAPNAAILATVANAYYEIDDLTQAIELAAKASALDPKAERPARLYLLANRDRENYDDALRFGQAWIDRNTHGAQIYRDLAMIAHDAGDLPRAYQLASEGFKREPGDARIAGVYFYYAARFQTPELVHAEAEKWSEDHAATAYFYAQVGKRLSDANAAALALPLLQKALRLGSTDSGVATEIMDSYRELGDYTMADAFVENYLDTHEPTAAIWRSLGAIYYDNDLYEEALDATTKALELAPDDPIAAGNMIFTLNELSRPRDGIEFGTKWLATSKQAATSAFHRALGHAHFAEDEFAEAEHEYREALKIEPDHVFAARDLISTLIREDRPADAVTFGEAWHGGHPAVHEPSFDEALDRAREAAHPTKGESRETPEPADEEAPSALRV